MKQTVIYHKADYDGIFCREIARKFLPEAELIGWDFGDAPLDPGLYTLSKDNRVYVLDLPCDAIFGLKFPAGKAPESAPGFNQYVWIDHHKSAIDSHPKDIPGYRIDGVAACRLAWQWFATLARNTGDTTALLKPDLAAAILPTRGAFANRNVTEPIAVRLAGEYDIWDKRDPDAELFQHGLRSQPLDNLWEHLLSFTEISGTVVRSLLDQGRAIQYAKSQENESIIKGAGFTVKWEGLTFLACNSARYNSHLFTAGIRPEHEGLLGFNFDGKEWRISLYGVPGQPYVDLAAIAARYGGGGHKQACGFRAKSLPWIQ